MARKKYKMPKKPKRSASLKTWENYTKKVAEVKKKNAKLESDKKKKERLISKNGG